MTKTSSGGPRGFWEPPRVFAIRKPTQAAVAAFGAAFGKGSAATSGKAMRHRPKTENQSARGACRRQREPPEATEVILSVPCEACAEALGEAY